MPVHTQIIIPATSPLINYQGKSCSPKPQTGFDGGLFVSSLCLDPHFHPTQCAPVSTSFLDGVSTPPISSQLSPQAFSIFEAPPVNATTTGLHNWTIVSSQSVHFHSFSLTSNVTSLENSTVRNDEPVFVYKPPAAWTNTSTTEHSTTQANASVTFTFKGDRVALYGAVVQGRYTAQVDGGQTFNFADNFDLNQPIPDQLLFYTDGLESGNHSVVVSASSGLFSISYAVVDGTSNPVQTSSSSSSPASTNLDSLPTTRPSSRPHPAFSNNHGLSQPQLIGIMAGIAVLMTLLILALAYIFWRRRVRRRTKASESKSPSTTGTATPLQWPPQPFTHQAVQGVAQSQFAAQPAPQIENPHAHAYFQERPAHNWTNSVYSQSSTVAALDQVYRDSTLGYTKATRNAKSSSFNSHYSSDSYGMHDNDISHFRGETETDVEHDVGDHPRDVRTGYTDGGTGYAV
ncbi:hypothetical protein C8R46DRAFT_1118184 [Mycena filopes]|nr:hypothetical protein C8R46DRAFT_1118184 [Mycena filopes]